MTDTPDVAQLLANADAAARNTDADVSEIETIVVETVSAFEARLQHHFARGPFFVKLRNKLVAEGHVDLAETVYHYYLAANVLKHGGGKSLRELEKLSDQPFTLQDVEGKALIDVTANRFLAGLVETLGQAHDILTTV
ncbi:hypothetical protein [uncultured Sulfitobacter sp.]|uniref:hypothetical protein n=1 Tax=uncultured Sulfitobacter sp. TaxID=191468 RepID=UPI00262E8B37|nr:hypothetical protein [uncultured Sulfitobacter sp.]